jgi:hypothetical protein
MHAHGMSAAPRLCQGAQRLPHAHQPYLYPLLKRGAAPRLGPTGFVWGGSTPTPPPPPPPGNVGRRVE